MSSQKCPAKLPQHSSYFMRLHVVFFFIIIIIFLPLRCCLKKREIPLSHKSLSYTRFLASSVVQSKIFPNHSRSKCSFCCKQYLTSSKNFYRKLIEFAIICWKILALNGGKPENRAHKKKKMINLIKSAHTDFFKMNTTYKIFYQ